MRIWDMPVWVLCNKHLVAEHRELPPSGNETLGWAFGSTVGTPRRTGGGDASSRDEPQVAYSSPAPR
jgi:hypothetical protein